MQEAMGRATTDVILAAGNFGTELNALNFQPCPELDTLHYCIGDAMRCVSGIEHSPPAHSMYSGIGLSLAYHNE